MNKKSNLIYYLLCVYIFINPIIPFNFKLGNHFTDLILMLLIVIYVGKAIKNKDMFIKNLKDFTTDLLGISLCAFLLIMFVSVSYATDKHLALSESARFMSFVFLFFIIKYNLNKSNVKGIINLFIMSFVIVDFYCIFQKITGFGLVHKYYMGNGIERIQGTFDNPNALAAFLLIGTFPVVMLIIESKNTYKKVVYSLLIVLTLVNIYFSGSRNSFVAIAIGGIAVSILYNKLLLIGVGGTGIISMIIPQTRARIMDIGNMTYDESRFKLWKTALKMIKEHPILGVGNGNFTTLYDSYVKKYKELAYADYSHFPSHNSYLKVESELGIIGGISFVSIIVNALLKIRKVIKVEEDRFLNLFYVGFLASVIGFLAMNFFENLFFLPVVTTYFWIFLASAEALLICKE